MPILIFQSYDISAIEMEKVEIIFKTTLMASTALKHLQMKIIYRLLLLILNNSLLGIRKSRESWTQWSRKM